MSAGCRGVRLGAVLCLVLAGPGEGQGGGHDEVPWMRQATLLEAAGDLAGAEAVLDSILDQRPASVPALLALERVLQQVRRLDELPARVTRGLLDDPQSALLNQLLLRTYSRLDRPEELEAAAAAWMEAAPGIESSYRHVARVWEARGDYDRAREVLEVGRRNVAGDDALAFELGALYATLGNHRLAAREWDRAIGSDGRGVSQVRRGFRALPDGGVAVLPTLLDLLAADPTTPERLAAAVELSVAAGIEPEATGLAARVAAMHSGERRVTFLLDLARRADGARLHRLAHWAYGQLLGDAEFDERDEHQRRYVELALELGEGGGDDARLGAPAAPHGRHAEAARIQLLAVQDPVQAAEALRSFREAYGEAPELDRLSADVAESLSSSGAGAADAVVAGVRGPRSALVRGRLALAKGDRATAREAFMAAAAGLAGTEATRTLSLVALLDRVSSEGAGLLALMISTDSGGGLGDAIRGVLDSSRRLPPAERAAILEFAAATADGVEHEADARRIRRGLWLEHPHSPEAPAALLALARSVRAEDETEARILLERLIIDYPRSTVVPQARRELDELRRGSARTGTTNHDPGR
jgi:hypothetical protein